MSINQILFTPVVDEGNYTEMNSYKVDKLLLKKDEAYYKITWYRESSTTLMKRSKRFIKKRSWTTVPEMLLTEFEK